MMLPTRGLADLIVMDNQPVVEMELAAAANVSSRVNGGDSMIRFGMRSVAAAVVIALLAARPLRHVIGMAEAITTAVAAVVVRVRRLSVVRSASASAPRSPPATEDMHRRRPFTTATKPPPASCFAVWSFPMKKPSGGVALFAVVALLSLPPVALAQSASAPAPSAAAPPAANAPADSPAQQRVEARIKQLHSQLHITAAEESQWQQFAQTMRDNAREIDEAAMQRSQQFPTMTAVENLQSYETLAESRVQHLQKLVPAFQSLYDAMSPEQKKNADEVFRASAQARAQAQSGNQ